MALITNPRVTRFSNENARVIANQAMRLYRTAKQFQLNVVDFEEITQPYQASDELNDGADVSGRPIVTKQNSAELKFVIEQLVGAFETDDRLSLLNNWTHDTTPYF